MQLFYCDQFVLPLPPGHRFPMQKYALLRERLAASKLFAPESFRLPPAATEEELCRAHDADYVAKAIAGRLSIEEVRAMGFPWSAELIERSRRSSGATIEAAKAALEEGVGVNLAGGTHHAFRNRGEGFCVFNDSIVAARALQAEGRVRRVAIIDVDVHQGNGTASIAAGDDSIYTFSIHGANNYPLRKETSDLDVALPDQTGDETYLAALAPAVEQALEQSRPDLAIYLAGADPYLGDKLGRMRLTKAGLAARDALVFELCRQARLPIAISMAGGYAHDIADIVDIHAQTVTAARALEWKT